MDKIFGWMIALWVLYVICVLIAVGGAVYAICHFLAKVW